jgi:hypothetical protein
MTQSPIGFAGTLRCPLNWDLWDSVIRFDDGRTDMSPPLGSAFSPPAGLHGRPRRLDPRKHSAGGFIVGVLRHQFTPECFGEDCLVEMVD